MKDLLTTHEVAQAANVHRDTLLRWLRVGRIPEPARDRNGWRVFTQEETRRIVLYARNVEETAQPLRLKENPAAYVLSPVIKLAQLDWDFAESNTSYLTHGLHPYPAKFIPQIPNTLIQELSSVGDTVLDPFCGSGTALVEALLLRRHAVGVDANPLACLISRAKTTRVAPADLDALQELRDRAAASAQQQVYRTLPLFSGLADTQVPPGRPTFEGVDFWFEPHVVDELSALKAMCLAVSTDAARDIALTTFSSIIVSVSRQDSDTRYVRREKDVRSGDTAQRFLRSLDIALTRASDFTELTEPRFTSRVIHANSLDGPDVGRVDLVVCSPPYPNAYSYHLYHRTRMLWLDMDQPTFKDIEIGSHRKYSRKANGATADTFRSELLRVLTWLRGCLRPGAYACFVIGDSVLRGRVVHNDELLAEVASAAGYRVEANLTRRLQDTKKSFNPAIGKIKHEHIVILRNPEA